LFPVTAFEKEFTAPAVTLSATNGITLPSSWAIDFMDPEKVDPSSVLDIFTGTLKPLIFPSLKCDVCFLFTDFNLRIANLI
jgi:hypothetical protein